MQSTWTRQTHAYGPRTERHRNHLRIDTHILRDVVYLGSKAVLSVLQHLCLRLAHSNVRQYEQGILCSKNADAYWAHQQTGGNATTGVASYPFGGWRRRWSFSIITGKLNRGGVAESPVQRVQTCGSLALYGAQTRLHSLPGTVGRR